MVCMTPHCQPESVEQLKLQNTQDGWFHLAVWILTVIGVVLLFKAARQIENWSGKALVGAMLLGWGLFNFVEGIIDHQLLGIHHVVPGSPHQFAFDMLFLGSGVTLTFIGWTLASTDDNEY